MTKRLWIAALCLSALMSPLQSSNAAAPSTTGLKLPDERLVLVSGNPTRANFLAPDSIVWNGRRADILIYTVFEPPTQIAKDQFVVECVARQGIDCDAHTHQDLGSEGYDKDGKSLVQLPERPVEPIAPTSSLDYMAKVVCDKLQLPAERTAPNRAAAKAMAIKLLWKAP